MVKDRRVRYAVVGAGNIAQVAVLPAFEHASENSRLVAVISGNPEKRAILREQYKLELEGGYGDLESILECGRIDAVYIATPNSLHKEYALRAAAKGVHVLCEKPLAPTVQDCESMAEACDQHGVKLMVAYRLHFEEGNLQAIDVARSGQLGELRYFSSSFSHVVRADDIRRDPALGGGATYDLGVYCVNAARNLFGAEPTWVFGTTIEANDTDDTTIAVLRFPEGRLAQFCVSNTAADASSYRITGTRGDLRVEPAYDYQEPIIHHLTVNGQAEHKVFRRGDQFAPELVYFSNCILDDLEPEPSAEEGICDVRVIEAILRSARTGEPVGLAPFQRRRRPSLAQEMYRPPVGPQETVDAPGPSEH